MLDLPRAVTVYLPPSQPTDHPLPVVFAADGQMVPDLACSLESSTLFGGLPPVALVGVHYSRSPATNGPGSDGRNREYVYGTDDDAYISHESFFMSTVISWAESRFPISREPADRAVFGASSGASFATAASRRHPSVFGAVIAFSHAFDGLDSTVESGMTGTHFYLMYGDGEAYVDETTKAVASTVRSSGGTATVGTWNGGHDSDAWKSEFPTAVEWFLNVTR